MSKTADHYTDGIPRHYSRILRLPEVMRLTGLSKSSIYSLISKSDFPKQKVITERCRGWDEDEIQDWILTKLSKKKDFDFAVGDEIPF